MTAKQLMLPANRAFNSDGAPEVGAMAFLYLSGTSTPALFYEDVGLTVSLGSSITANSAGRFEPMPYQDNSIPFRLVVQDEEGAVLDDIDPFFFGFQQGVAGPQGPAGDVAKVADRTALAAIGGLSSGMTRFLVEAGREGTYVFNTSNLSTQVTNDPNQGVYVAPASDTTGASGAWVRKFSGELNVKWFGAKGDANADGSTGTDDTSAIQAGLNAINAAGGGTLFFPTGNYKITAYLTFYPNTYLRGTGRKSSKIVGTHAGGGGANSSENIRNGSILVNLQTINTSTRIDCHISDLWLFNSNVANQGAGIYQQSGVILVVNDCEVTGSKWGIILDQTELAYINRCELGANVAGGMGLWIVNGASINPAASGGFTNIISVRDCSLNVLSTAYCAVDDGGSDHIFDGCNFNGGINGLRVTGCSGIQILNSYAESQTAEIFHIDSVKSDGGSAGGGTTIISGGQFSPTAGNCAIKGYNSPGTLLVEGGSWSTSTPNPLVGTANFFSVNIISPGYSGYPTAASFCDGIAGGRHLEPSKLNMSSTGELTVPTSLLVNGASGSFRKLAFQTAGSDSFSMLIGGSNGDLFSNIPLSYTWRVNSVDIVYWDSSGMNLRSGGFYVGGTQVVNSAHILQAAAFPVLTGDVTTAGGALATTIANTAVTYAKMQNVTAARLLGNPTGGATSPSEISLAADHAFSGTSLQLGAFTGDITKSAGSLATTVAANAVTYAKFQTVAANSLVGNPTGSTATAQGITLAGGLSFSGTTLTAAGALTPTSIASTGAITSSSASAGIGYATGAGGTVTQLTSRTTGVTLNKLSGAITLFAAAGSATFNTFTVTNSSVAATDTISINQKSGTDKYIIHVTAIAAGSFAVTFATTGGTTSESPVFQFNVIKGVNA